VCLLSPGNTTNFSQLTKYLLAEQAIEESIPEKFSVNNTHVGVVSSRHMAATISDLFKFVPDSLDLLLSTIAGLLEVQ
jgi:hypothetical protein